MTTALKSPQSSRTRTEDRAAASPEELTCSCWTDEPAGETAVQPRKGARPVSCPTPHPRVGSGGLLGPTSGQLPLGRTLSSGAKAPAPPLGPEPQRLGRGSSSAEMPAARRFPGLELSFPLLARLRRRLYTVSEAGVRVGLGGAEGLWGALGSGPLPWTAAVWLVSASGRGRRRPREAWVPGGRRCRHRWGPRPGPPSRGLSRGTCRLCPVLPGQRGLVRRGRGVGGRGLVQGHPGTGGGQE